MERKKQIVRGRRNDRNTKTEGEREKERKTKRGRK